ncbi:hypothetical protein IPN41_02945 [Candidatus Falkowbacteria bacterium]|nr:MAG: hypothetical protein IPN41_02945 [Candidatus Falkowbacteria bacterium]
MSDRLQRLIHLINKTGDKLIVFDQQNPDNCYVISGLSDYEHIVKEGSDIKGLTEDELIDKINRDIAIWKNGQVQGSEFSDFSQEYTGNQENVESEISQSWSPPKPSFERQVAKNNWTIPESRRREADLNI